MAYKDKQALYNSILSEIEQGASLLSVLKKEGMPNRVTFFVWMKESEDNTNNYARAIKARSDVLFDEMIEIAYTPEEGEVIKSSSHGVETTTSDMLGHRRLKIDTLKWILSRMDPKKYGDKMSIEQETKSITEIVLTDATINTNS